ncbi:protein MpSUVR4 [Marchantia polymorpha subsp. ruderalis]|uniref:SET domain-containing protein n=3 Tax=Marchantia polymorpha TaxID=3197 RepID=A0AAF6B667_MARPO|nr:hypothetical protein MARPO_0044s0058 [Marchantia polymorpha]BBN07501.1 hypothetical protein Mp_4g04150 [Marchantia polymorpha subsp. ruderalis]|eukprot:PTQ39599.1 hypothetical protein MARPO_0044s0058 [Marchantia polymorpha]
MDLRGLYRGGTYSSDSSGGQPPNNLPRGHAAPKTTRPRRPRPIDDDESGPDDGPLAWKTTGPRRPRLRRYYEQVVRPTILPDITPDSSERYPGLYRSAIQAIFMIEDSGETIRPGQSLDNNVTAGSQPAVQISEQSLQRVLNKIDSGGAQSAADRKGKAVAQQTVSRKRGRPRKNTVPSYALVTVPPQAGAVAAQDGAESDDEPPKKRRGRPPKNTAPVNSVPPVNPTALAVWQPPAGAVAAQNQPEKRKPGRPRKNPVPSYALVTVPPQAGGGTGAAQAQAGGGTGAASSSQLQLVPSSADLGMGPFLLQAQRRSARQKAQVVRYDYVTTETSRRKARPLQVTLPNINPTLNTEGQFRKLFEKDELCDLCGRGPSLNLGEWYNWCCSKNSIDCDCKDSARKIQVFIQRMIDNGVWPNGRLASGKVHVKCGLWSNEVTWAHSMLTSRSKKSLTKLPEALEAAMSKVCTICHNLGASVSCIQRPNGCTEIYHYPCAESVSVGPNYIRIWTGPFVRDIDKMICHAHIDEVERDELEAERTFHQGNVAVLVPFPGVRLLSPDFSNQVEPTPIPVYNDVDDEPVPPIQYVRYLSFNGVEVRNLSPYPNPDGTPVQEIENSICGNCSNYDNDDPHVDVNRHAYCLQRKFLTRYTDRRQDWQGVNMFGRLCYTNGLLQLRDSTRPVRGQGVQPYRHKDIVECFHAICGCLATCQNGVSQRDQMKRVELYRTEHHFWGVRAAERIPRGAFIMEYVGEVISSQEASRRETTYDSRLCSYTFAVDHYPEFRSLEDPQVLVIDGENIGNVCKYVNHSCSGNAEMFRVYTNLLNLGCYHLCLFAIQDIKRGEEICYDYGYEFKIYPDDPNRLKDPNKIRCLCKAGPDKCRKWLK